MLRHLPHPELPAYAGPEGLLRARAMREHLLRLRGAALTRFPLPPARVALFVLDEAAWRRRTRRPYGLPAYERGAVLVPEGLSQRALFALLHAFTQAGARPAGPAAEVLDLAAGPRYFAAWLGEFAPEFKKRERELLSAGLWLFALNDADPEAHARALAWSRVLLPAEGRGLAGELGRLLFAVRTCGEALEACETTLFTLLKGPYPAETKAAMLEPWRRWLQPEGSRATRSNASPTPATNPATGKASAPRREKNS